MPEFKRTFTGGKMEKDLDERIVPNGLYREALNIEVSTSEGADVGAAENVLGNIKITEAINGPPWIFDDGSTGWKYARGNRHIALIADPETDMLYRFINTEAEDTGVWMDRIIEHDTTKTLTDPWETKEAPVLIDIYKVETECVGGGIDECNRPWIKVYKNYAQLRPYMAIDMGYLVDYYDYYIQNITYGSDGGGDYAIVTLSKIYVDRVEDLCVKPLVFIADRVLNFHPDRKITGINVIDGMIFWTDNYSEPKKVHIERGKLGSKYFLNPNNSAQFTWKYRHFDQHTRLIINVDEVTGLGENPWECIKLEEICPVPGCIDPIALNYDPDATVDDGSCIYPIYGCTDDTPGHNPDIYGNCLNGSNVGYPNPGGCWLGAVPPNAYNGYLHVNFDPNANTNAVSATDPSDPCCDVGGCMDINSCNYNPLACYDNGTCFGIVGCEDPLATNYNPLATCPCTAAYLQANNLTNCCDFLYECAPPGYGSEECYTADGSWWTELMVNPSTQYSTTFWPHRAFESLANAGSGSSEHNSTVRTLWMTKTGIPAGNYSTNPNAGNYYANTGQCIFPGVGGTWSTKFHLAKLTIGNLLPTDPIFG